MADEFYKRLGVSKNASQDEIQKAYLKLARKYHPDMNPDNPEEAKKKFQELQEAFETLKDPDKRKLYDQFGAGYQQYSGAGGGAGGFSGNPFGGVNMEDILRGFAGGAGGAGGSFKMEDILRGFTGGGGGFGFGGGRSRRRASSRGADTTSSLTIDFKTSILGGKIPITVRDPQSGTTRNLDVTIPPGIESGKKIRLRGQGEPGVGGGEKGDLLIAVTVKPHAYYSREGKNLTVRLPISLQEAAFGATVDFPTPYGEVKLKIPAGSTSGAKLRLKGYGVRGGKGADGDLFAVFEVQLPKEWSKSDLEALKSLSSQPSNLRSGLAL